MRCAGGVDGVVFLDEREWSVGAMGGASGVVGGPVERGDVEDFHPLAEVARDGVEEKIHGGGGAGGVGMVSGDVEKGEWRIGRRP